MNCQEFKTNIESYLDEDLGDKISREFKKHLTSCRKCSIELKSFEKCKQLMGKIFEEKDPPQSIKKAVFEKCGCFKLKNFNCCSPEKDD